MVPSPLHIAVIGHEPTQAAYLRAALQVELPGLIVLDVADSASTTAPDLVLLQADPDDPRPVAAHGASPVIVVARGPLPLAAIEALVRDGAEDVLDLLHVTGTSLAAAVLKAVGRRGRARRPERPHHGLAPGSSFPDAPSFPEALA